MLKILTLLGFILCLSACLDIDKQLEDSALPDDKLTSAFSTSDVIVSNGGDSAKFHNEFIDIFQKNNVGTEQELSELRRYSGSWQGSTLLNKIGTYNHTSGDVCHTLEMPGQSEPITYRLYDAVELKEKHFFFIMMSAGCEYDKGLQLFVAKIENNVVSLANTERDEGVDKDFEVWRSNLGMFDRIRYLNADNTKVKSYDGLIAYFRENYHELTFRPMYILNGHLNVDSSTALFNRLFSRYVQVAQEKEDREKALKAKQAREAEAEAKRQEQRAAARKARVQSLNLGPSIPSKPSNFSDHYMVFNGGSILRFTSHTKGVWHRDKTDYGLNRVYLEHFFGDSFEFHQYLSDKEVDIFEKQNSIWRRCNKMWHPKIDYQVTPLKDTETNLYYQSAWLLKQKTLECHEVSIRSESGSGRDCKIGCAEYRPQSDDSLNNLILTKSKLLAESISDDKIRNR